MKEITLDEALLILLNDFSTEELLSMTPELIIELASVEEDELTDTPCSLQDREYAQRFMGRIITRTTKPSIRILCGLDEAEGAKCTCVTYPSNYADNL